MTAVGTVRRRGGLAVLVVLVPLMFLSPGSAAVATAAPAVLAQWRSALDHRHSVPVSWVAYGDSITEGQGASSRQSRWIDRTTARLRTVYPTAGAAGGAGYLPGWYAVKAPDSPWKPYSARTGSVTNIGTGSLGLRTARLAAGATQTYTVTGTSLDLYYMTGGGMLTWQVDGGAVHAVNTAGAYRTDNRVEVTFDRAGTYRFTVRAAAGTVGLEGVAVFDGDRNRGVRVFDNSHSGFTTGQFLDSRTDVDPVLALIKPDLVTIALGANDYLKRDVTPARMAANLKMQIADIRTTLAAKVPSIVLVLPYNLPVRSGVLADWSKYADAIRSVAAADPSVGLLDFTSLGQARPGGFFSADGLHPSDAGQTRMAEIAAAYLDAR